MARKPGLNLKHAYAVIAVPESGLFVKDGEFISGHGTSMRVSELVLFSRRSDADLHAFQCGGKWAETAEKWLFPVIPVLVSERL
jgi:hypothetical protein